MPTRILISAWNAYPAINPLAGGAVGGLETFSWSLARELARDPEVEVSFCIRETRPLAEKSVEEVRLISVIEPLRKIRHQVSCDLQRTRSFPWLKLSRFRPALLWQVPLLVASKLLVRRPLWSDQVRQIIHDVQPDVVLTLGVNADSAVMMPASRQEGIPALLWLQSNGDVESQFWSDPAFQDQYQVTSAEARASLENADFLICQTDWQKQAALSLLSKPVELIPNPVDSVRFSPLEETFDSREGVLWIGRYDRFHKRPLLALEIARRCPEISFQFVINAGQEDVKEEVRRNLPKNVKLLDYVPHDQMPVMFRQSRFFLSTGSHEFEGFPNVLLEAAASGTPICSLEDFDRFLLRSEGGEVTEGDLQRAAHWLAAVNSDSSRWHSFSSAGRKYVREHHSREAVAKQFLELVERIRFSIGTFAGRNPADG